MQMRKLSRALFSAATVVMLLGPLLGCRPAITPVTGPAAVAPANAAYERALSMWSKGYQLEAERMLEDDVRRYPESQRLALFQAACVRSRFKNEEAFELFAHVYKMDYASVEGLCVNYVGNLDLRKNVDKNFAYLLRLVKQNPNDPIPLWLLAIEWREHDRSEDGIHYYEKLLTMVEGGSALVHQTYANLLDEVGQHDKALPHRKTAIQLEPADWAYAGLAQTERMMREKDKDPFASMMKKPNISEQERRVIYVEGILLRDKLEKKYKRPLQHDSPEMIDLRKKYHLATIDLRKKYHLTEKELFWIQVEGDQKRWASTPD